MSKSRLVSGKVKTSSYEDLDSTRFDFLDLSNAEPNLGLPENDGKFLAGNLDGTRFWTDPAVGFVGSQGFTGSIGFTGSQGDLGFTGSRGFTGSLGDTGFVGSRGDLGFTGSIGFTGSQGAGFTGSIGFTGSQGIPGEAAAIGFTGSAGSQGFTGSGGFVGSAGSDGILGGDGAPGYTGSQGPIGYTGSAAETGSSAPRFLSLIQEGNLRVLDGISRWYAPASVTITKIIARVDEAPTGNNLLLRINKVSAGVTTSINIAITASTFKTENNSPNLTLAADDYLTVDVTQIGGTNPGKGLRVTFIYE